MKIIDATPVGNQTVIVQVNVSVDDVKEEHKYFVTVTPSVELGPIVSFITENSTFQLEISVLYNHEYAVSVVANNCAGNSTVTTTTFNISKT